MWKKTSDYLPTVPEHKDSVMCLVYKHGGQEILEYDTYHECWNTADGDDYCCDISAVDYWMELPDNPNHENVKQGKEKRGCCVIISTMIDNVEKFLLCKRSEIESSGTGQWCFPGGTVNYEEESVVAAARELFEETGIKVYPHALDKVSEYMFCEWRDFVYSLFEKKLDLPAVGISDEVSEYILATEQEIEEMVKNKTLFKYSEKSFSEFQKQRMFKC